MATLGKEIFNAVQQPERITNAVRKVINQVMPVDATDAEKDAVFYRSIYEYWVYGNSITESFAFNFAEKSHAEKMEYLVTRPRMNVYTAHLNNAEKANSLLNNKFNAYKFFRKYYRRDAVLISGEEDFVTFQSFVTKYPIFVSKPVNFGTGLNIRKNSLTDYETPRKLFEALLKERKMLAADPNRTIFLRRTGDVDLILEELIEQSPLLAKLHPQSLNTIRITTVRVRGKIHIFYPFLKIGTGDSFVDNGGAGGLLAGIDTETGIVYTDLFDEFKHYNNPLKAHPDTGIAIKGFQLPQWNEAVALCKELAAKLDGDINFVGWDLGFTPEGWCVVEGNPYGDVIVQQITNRKGLRREFEELTGWKPEGKFWWEYQINSNQGG